MNIAAMHIAFKLEVDKSSALELPAFEPEEIDLWLNNAIRKFVKTRYSGLNSKQQGFEETQKRTDDLRTLVNHVSIGEDGSGEYANSVAFPIPTSPYPPQYLFSLQETCTIDRSVGDDLVVGVTECTIDEYRAKLDDPFSEHILHYNTAKPLRFFMNDNIELVHDGTYDITYLHLTYLKEPATVQVTATAVDCDLPDHTHDEIVKMAANMVLESIEQPRYQTHSNELNTME